MTATLAFGDVSGHRLLSQITYPDGLTSVVYAYDGLGNLTSVTLPANNSSGAQPHKLYTYQALGSGTILWASGDARWVDACGATGCGTDGGILDFAFTGSSNAVSAVSQIWHEAVVNPVIADGTNTAPQSNYPTTAQWYLGEYYTTGVTTPTFRDTDGHMINWVVDGAGRPTQTQVCTATTNGGTQCPSTALLTSTATWDVNNNLTAAVNVRGAETDAAYDLNGNAVAIAQPQPYQGLPRPTTLIDYDSFNNVVAYCDPALVNTTPAADWSGQYWGGSDNYCSSAFSSGRVTAQYNTSPSYEPYGELAAVTTAGGYTTQIAYDPGPQGGTDYGLPTRATGASFTQLDGSSRQAVTSGTYDSNGNLLCRQTNVASGTTATSVMTYDSLSRMVAVADPDDASVTGACTAKVAGIGAQPSLRATHIIPTGRWRPRPRLQRQPRAEARRTPMTVMATRPRRHRTSRAHRTHKRLPRNSGSTALEGWSRPNSPRTQERRETFRSRNDSSTTSRRT